MKKVSALSLQLVPPLWEGVRGRPIRFIGFWNTLWLLWLLCDFCVTKNRLLHEVAQRLLEVSHSYTGCVGWWALYV